MPRSSNFLNPRCADPRPCPLSLTSAHHYAQDSVSMMTRAFQVQPQDNVATLLDDAVAGPIELVGGAASQLIQLLEPVKLGHKVALANLRPGDAVVKLGVPIGHATKAIERGSWVHLHNLASDLDERSGTLDVHSGAPTDTRYE